MLKYRGWPKLDRLSRDARGDTIVEVLISIAIVSLVLVVAYQTSTRNAVALQSNQERIQAQHLVEAQIEALRANSGLAAGYTCFNTAGAPANGTNCVRSGVNGSGASYTLYVALPGATIPAPCQHSSTVAYTACAHWTGIGDKTDDASNVTMYYVEPAP